jgi:hypothetical protein
MNLYVVIHWTHDKERPITIRSPRIKVCTLIEQLHNSYHNGIL